MRNLLLSTVTLLVVPAVALAAPDFSSHTHTTPIELEPISSSSGLKLASVCFLGYGDCGDGGFDSIAGDDGYIVDTEKQCQNEGYKKLNCSSVQVAEGICPYNSSYGRGCKCIDNLITCNEWQKGVGESCNGQYVSCICVDGVYAGQYGCAEYYPAPCSSVCKKAYADNCHIRSDNNSAIYGCMKYWSDCSSKCETPYPDNCRNRTEVSCEFGCSSYYGDCSSKCAVCKTDNCANRMAVSIPSNGTCSAYYDDCSTKCSTWDCNKGYQKSGNRCILELPLLYGDGTVSYEPYILSGKTPIGIVLDTSKRLAVALTDVRRDGSPGSEYMSFSEKAADTALDNCRMVAITCYIDDDSCEKDGKSSTNIILSDKNLGKTYAASAVNAFEPVGCIQSFCRRGNWFLPVMYDLTKMYCNSEAVSVAAALAGANPDLLGFMRLSYSYNIGGYTHYKMDYMGYWSSTEKDAQHMWYSYGASVYGDKNGATSTLSYQSYVRPFIRY